MAQKAVKRHAEDMKEYLSSMTASQGEIPPFGCGDPAYESAAPLPTCPESCTTCASHYLPHLWQKLPSTRSLKVHDDSRAAEEVQNLTTAIDEDLAFVRKNIEKNGNLMEMRWGKRSANERAKLLLKAKPGMYEHRWLPARLHFDMAHKTNAAITSALASSFTSTINNLQNSDIVESASKLYELWLLPYLDIPTLSRSASRLLALLHNRSHSRPSDWVMFDFEQLKLPFNAAVYVQVAYNPHCVSMRDGTYGQLVKWDERAAHRFDVVGYPRARLVLQSQQALSTFLRRITELILGNHVNGTATGRDIWDNAASMGFKARADIISGSVSLDRPFSPPPKLELLQLVQNLRFRRNAAADEVWLLQVDPVYTRQHFARLMNTPFYDRLTAPHQCLEALKVLLYPTGHLQLWELSVAEAEKVLEVKSKYQGLIHDGGDLPSEYCLALSTLQSTLEAQLSGQISMLQVSVRKSSTFRHHFTFNNDGRMHVDMKREEMFHTQPILWSITELCDDRSEYAQDPSFHVAFIEDVITHASQKDRAAMDTRLYHDISSISTASDAISAIKLGRPHHGPKMADSQFNEVMSKSEDFQKYKHQINVVPLLLDKWLDVLSPPIRAFLALPLPASGPTKEGFKRTRDLHNGLCEVWDVIRTSAAVVLGGASRSITEIQEYLEPISAALSTSYKNELRDELLPLLRASLSAEISGRAAPAKTISEPKQAQDIQTVWGTNPEDALRTVPTKVKQKTRPDGGAEKAAPSATIQVAEALEAEASPMPIAVTKTNKILLTRMIGTCAEVQGSVRWDQFVAAMVDAGFSATHNGGSAVTFKDEKQENGGAIVVHRPHPDPSIDPVMLRSIGKRLKKWFGWDAQTFVERQ